MAGGSPRHRRNPVAFEKLVATKRSRRPKSSKPVQPASRGAQPPVARRRAPTVDKKALQAFAISRYFYRDRRRAKPPPCRPATRKVRSIDTPALLLFKVSMKVCSTPSPSPCRRPCAGVGTKRSSTATSSCASSCRDAGRLNAARADGGGARRPRARAPAETTSTNAAAMHPGAHLRARVPEPVHQRGRARIAADVIRSRSLAGSDTPVGQDRRVDGEVRRDAGIEVRVPRRSPCGPPHRSMSACTVVYGTLAEAGYFDIEEAYVGFRRAGSVFGGHIEQVVAASGVEASRRSPRRLQSGENSSCLAYDASTASVCLHSEMSDVWTSASNLCAGTRHFGREGPQRLLLPARGERLQIGAQIFSPTSCPCSWPRSGAPTAGTSSRSTATTSRPCRSLPHGAARHEAGDEDAPPSPPPHRRRSLRRSSGRPGRPPRPRWPRVPSRLGPRTTSPPLAQRPPRLRPPARVPTTCPSTAVPVDATSALARSRYGRRRLPPPPGPWLWTSANRTTPSKRGGGPAHRRHHLRPRWPREDERLPQGAPRPLHRGRHRRAQRRDAAPARQRRCGLGRSTFGMFALVERANQQRLNDRERRRQLVEGTVATALRPPGRRRRRGGPTEASTTCRPPNPNEVFARGWTPTSARRIVRNVNFDPAIRSTHAMGRASSGRPKETARGGRCCPP